MMKLTPLFAVAFLAVACTPDLPPLPKTSQAAATTGSTSAATTASSPKPSKETAAAQTSTTSTSSTGSTTASTSAALTGALQPGDNPRRIHQLRELEHAQVTGGSSPIDVWLMDDDAKQQEGMMWLTDKDVKDDQGMLFVFPSAAQQSFWMQNTLIPLDIIYIDAKGKVLNIVHGKPRDESPLPSSGPAQYVLELKDGMAARYRIGPGTVLKIPANATYKPDESQQQNGMPPPGQ